MPRRMPTPGAEPGAVVPIVLPRKTRSRWGPRTWMLATGPESEARPLSRIRFPSNTFRCAPIASDSSRNKIPAPPAAVQPNAFGAVPLDRQPLDRRVAHAPAADDRERQPGRGLLGDQIVEIQGRRERERAVGQPAREGRRGDREAPAEPLVLD